MYRRPPQTYKMDICQDSGAATGEGRPYMSHHEAIVAALLVSQRDHWINFGGSSSRQITGDRSDADHRQNRD
jgi:hypothetical protein